MIEIHFVAGDNDGGPHVQVTLGDIDCEPEEVTDEQIVAGNADVRERYRKAFGEDPQSVVVWIT